MDPYLDLNTVVLDLGIKNRYFTSDKNLKDAVLLLQKNKVAVKCPTKDDDRMYYPSST